MSLSPAQTPTPASGDSKKPEQKVYDIKSSTPPLSKQFLDKQAEFKKIIACLKKPNLVEYNGTIDSLEKEAASHATVKGIEETAARLQTQLWRILGDEKNKKDKEKEKKSAEEQKNDAKKENNEFELFFRKEVYCAAYETLRLLALHWPINQLVDGVPQCCFTIEKINEPLYFSTGHQYEKKDFLDYALRSRKKGYNKNWKLKDPYTNLPFNYRDLDYLDKEIIPATTLFQTIKETFHDIMINKPLVPAVLASAGIVAMTLTLLPFILGVYASSVVVGAAIVVMFLAAWIASILLVGAIAAVVGAVKFIFSTKSRLTDLNYNKKEVTDHPLLKLPPKNSHAPSSSLKEEKAIVSDVKQKAMLYNSPSNNQKETASPPKASVSFNTFGHVFSSSNVLFPSPSVVDENEYTENKWQEEFKKDFNGIIDKSKKSLDFQKPMDLKDTPLSSEKLIKEFEEFINSKLKNSTALPQTKLQFIELKIVRLIEELKKIPTKNPAIELFKVLKNKVKTVRCKYFLTSASFHP